MNEPNDPNQEFDESLQNPEISDAEILQLVGRLLKSSRQVTDLEESNRDAQDGLELVKRALAFLPSGVLVDPSPEEPAVSAVGWDRRETKVAGPQPEPILGGKYKLVELIGEGGMGSVWKAEQVSPVRRQVAVKLIKPGLNTRQISHRFEMERHALAAMDHPNIAKILDGGVTDLGNSFFVMELVNGPTLTDYCDQARLSIPERLRLFGLVANAVQHAHQKGIIHRDLKPSNVLVTIVDGHPTPKLIDFGLSKAIGTSLPIVDSMATQFGSILGTLEYMAPEQTGSNSQDIDTRADVYSLGVILYELLTGLQPFDQKLKQAALNEVVRVIREDDPARPSTRLSSSDFVPTAAMLRRMEPKKLCGVLRNELDWIVMKALEKDRNRRYDSAGGLAADIQRFLSGEAVIAHPPSFIYRFTKFSRRYRGAVTAASLVLLSLVTGLVATLWQASLAKQEAARADERSIAAGNAEAEQRRLAESESRLRREAQNQKELAETAAAAEKARAAELETLAKFQSTLFDRLDVAEVGRRLADDLKARYAQTEAITQQSEEDRKEHVEAFAKSLKHVNTTDAAILLIDDNILKPAKLALDKSRKDSPLIDATLRSSLAKVYRKLGQFDQAISLQREVLDSRRQRLGESDLRFVEALNSLALFLQEAGNIRDSEPLAREAVRLNSKLRGENHPDTLTSQNNLALLLRAQGKLSEAESLFRSSWQRAQQTLGDENLTTVDFQSNLALALSDLGKLQEAEPLSSDVLAKRIRLNGIESLESIVAHNNQGMLLARLSRTSESESVFRKTVEISRRTLGNDHPQTLSAQLNLGSLLWQTGKLELAEPIQRETLERHRQVLGDNHPNTLMAINNYATLLVALDRASEALHLRREAVERSRTLLGPDHERTLINTANLAKLYEILQRPADAEPHWREVLEGFRRTRKIEQPQGILALLGLAQNLEQADRHRDAEPLLREVLQTTIKQRGPNDIATSRAFQLLGLNLLEQSNFEKAEKELLSAWEIIDGTKDLSHEQRQELIERMIELYSKWQTAKPEKRLEAELESWKNRSKQ